MAGKKVSAGVWLGVVLLAALAWWAFRPAPPVRRPGPEPVATPVAALPTVEPTAAAPAKVRLALVIDDWGYLAKPVQRLKMGLRFELTTAILPGLPYSRASAEASHEAGHEVILHCPVQALGPVHREKGTLLVGMAPEEVHTLLAEHWAAVPYLVGLNNHEGSAGSANRALMDAVAGFLKEQHAYFLDSVTTPKSVIPQAAKAAGIPWARRRVFLDNVDNVADIGAQLRQAVAIARKSGTCIAIGHPRPNTLDVLERLAPGLAAEGVTLVKVSDLVQP